MLRTKKYVRGTGGGKHIHSPTPKTEEEKDLLESIALSVTGLHSEFDSDAFMGIEGIPLETVEEIPVETEEISVDWSFPAAFYLQTAKNSCLQTGENSCLQKVESTTSVIESNHDYCKTPKSNEVKTLEEKILDTPSISSHWSIRRRPQIPKKKKCISSPGAKFGDLAEKKICLVKQTIEEKNNKEEREKIEHELGVKNLILENEILQLKKELLKKELELV